MPMSRRRLPKVVAKATEWARAQLIGPGNAGVCEWAAIERAVAFKMAVKRMTLKAERPLARATSGVGGHANGWNWEPGAGNRSSQQPGARISPAAGAELGKNERAPHDAHAFWVRISYFWVLRANEWGFDSASPPGRDPFGNLRLRLQLRCKSRATLAQSLDESQAAFNVQSPRNSTLQNYPPNIYI